MSLLDLTGAYASVRAGVAPVEPWGIAAFGTDEQARMFKLGPPVAPERQLQPYQEPLVGLLKLVVDRGTGRAAALDGFAAGKTGTSQNYRDAWFIGFNEALVVGVWVGNDDETPMDEVTGGKLPALIWRNFMTEAMAIAAGRRPAAEGEEAACGRRSRRRGDAEPCNATTAPAPGPTAPSARPTARSSPTAGSGSSARSDGCERPPFRSRARCQWRRMSLGREAMANGQEPDFRRNIQRCQSRPS